MLYTSENSFDASVVLPLSVAPAPSSTRAGLGPKQLETTPAAAASKTKMNQLAQPPLPPPLFVIAAMMIFPRDG